MPWEQLRDIRREAAALAAAEATTPPADCPLDATALQAGANGVRFCPWCGWRDE